MPSTGKTGDLAGSAAEAPVETIARLGRVRVVIESVTPQVDGGRFPCKRVVGESIRVEADVFTDGHDAVAADVLYRHDSAQEWQRVPMTATTNDRHAASFDVGRLGRYRYRVQAWVDPFETWRRDLAKRRTAGDDLGLAFRVGAGLARAAEARAGGADGARLAAWAREIEVPADPDAGYRRATDPAIAALLRAQPDPDTVADSDVELEAVVEPERARYSTWYELFPRSAAGPGRHGTLRDVEARLPEIAEMGFDVLYLPPIHPIGRAYRKGPNNSTRADANDVGSPWAIGAAEGGHKSVHPDLGDLEDVRRLAERAAAHGIALALDIAFQCSPDHPYVGEHPEWFLKRPDGTVQYAENPPKKYQDIYPFWFEGEQWQALWRELRDVVEFWVEHGVHVFRVDNPHTKPFAFWHWLIDDVKRRHPEVIFLSEAFTRPKVMHRLAKVGFSQSYTYFTWRNTKTELMQYFTELCHGPGREYFRPNVWPNTPDILPEFLQFGGRPAFVVRAVLAATLAASYGIYGPAFELGENQPREPGSEEYLDSEKYQLRDWDRQRPDSLRPLLTRLNRIRRDNPALQRDWGLHFHPVDNEHLIAYSKTGPEGSDAILVIVNLDVFHAQAGTVELPLDLLGVPGGHPYQMHDLLTGARYIWQGSRNYVALDPQGVAAHVFRLRRRVRTEQDFDYFM